MLREAVRAENTPWGRFLRDELDAIADAEDAYLFHEYFETVNEAVYLTDFVRNARVHGLDHLADADLTVASHALRPAPGDPIALAQSVDFAENRRFRAALLVRAETVAGRADAANLARLYLGTRAELTRDVSDRELRDDSAVAFVVGDERVEPRDPWIKCALAELASRARRPLSYPALSTAVGKRLGLDRPRALSLAAARAADVLELLYDGTLELRASEARYAEEAGLRPVASPLARMQSPHDALVTTYRHGRIEAPPFERALLPLLDGTRDRAALCAALHDGSPSIAGRVEEALEWCAQNALLR
jgi:hypothetical protein